MAQSSEELTSYVNKNHLGQVCLGFLVICGPKKVGNFKASVFQWHLMDHLGDTSPPPKKKTGWEYTQMISRSFLREGIAQEEIPKVYTQEIPPKVGG